MVNRFRNRSLCIVGCAMLSGLATSAARAAEWSLEPSIDLRGEYDSNIHLTPGPHNGVWGATLSPDARFRGATEALDVSGDLRFNLNRYWGESGLDTNDYIFGLRSTYKGERDVVGFNADAVRDSTLVSELAETGVVLTRDQRTRLTANPSWTHALTERTSIGASYTFNDVHYANTAGTGLVNYRDQTATVTLQQLLSEREIASIAGSWERYETAQSRATTYAVQVAYDRAFSESVHANVTVGARNTRTTLFSEALVCEGTILFGICFGNVTAIPFSVSETHTGYIFSASLDKRWETATLSGQVSHVLNPSGIGTLVETDRVALSWNQQWSPTVSYSVYGAAYQAKDIGSFSTGKSRYYTIEPRASWRITEWWTLTGGYRYNHAGYPGTSSNASDNVAYLVLTYTWPKLSVSR